MLFIAADQHEYLVFDAPRRICGELRAPPGAVSVYRLYQSDAADGDQVVRFRGSAVLFYDVRDQTHVVLYEHILRRFVALGGKAQVFCLLFGRERLREGAFPSDRRGKNRSFPRIACKNSKTQT